MYSVKKALVYDLPLFLVVGSGLVRHVSSKGFSSSKGCVLLCS
jgi:hypothetical protein